MACLADPRLPECVRWRSFSADLRALAAAAPEDRYVVGQVVYGLVRGRDFGAALEVLEGCTATPWWCRVLRGFVLAESRRTVEAEVAFDQALLLMPEEERCVWSDLSLLLPGRVWGPLDDGPCRDRLVRLETDVWWLVDSSWIVPGNDRKVEHYDRMTWAALHDDALTGGNGDGRVADGAGHSRGHHLTVVRGGMDYLRVDARWHVDRDRPAYRVIPDEAALRDPLHAGPEAFSVEPGRSTSQHWPPFGGLAVLDAQVAFFERGDSVAVAAAMDVPDDRAFRLERQAAAALFLHSGAEAPTIRVDSEPATARWLFRTVAPRRRYVVGLEARVVEGVGRARFGHGLPHDVRAPLRVSDLLLFIPNGPPPDSLGAAAPLMRGGSVWSPGETLGVFFEVYGPDDASTFPVSVELERERGLLARVGKAIGLGGGDPVNLRWSQPGPSGRVPVSFTLDLRDVPEGDHTLRVSVGGPGTSPAVVERAVRIERRDE